jgi:glutamate:GABA antiporter
MDLLMSVVSTNDEKVLSFKDVTLMTVACNFGIRWLAVAAGLGASAIFFWIVGALMFFIPLTIIAIYLSEKYPQEGGAYAWTKLAFGEKSGFMVAWLYWVNNLFYYPTLLIFFAANFAYFIGMPEKVHDQVWVTSLVIVVFWGIILVNLYGLKASKLIGDLGGILGSIFPAVLIIILGVSVFIIFGSSATDFSIDKILPHDSILNNLSTLTIIMFAMAGIEIIPTFANSVKGGGKTLYKSLMLSAFLLMAFYILGTVAINIILAPEDISQTSGLIEAFNLLGQKFGISWLAHLMAFLLTFSELAAITIWLVAPITMFFKCTPRGILPNWLHKTNKYNAPSNGLVFMGAIVSVIILATNLLPSVDSMYHILILMATVLYFIPYIYVVFAYLKLGEKSVKKYVVSILVLISLVLGIIFSFQPPSDLKTAQEIFIYEFELILGPVIFIVIGWLLYKFRRDEL